MTKLAAMMAVDDVAAQLEFKDEVVLSPSVQGSVVGDASKTDQSPVQFSTASGLESEVQVVEKSNTLGTVGKPYDVVKPSTITPLKRPLEPANKVTDEDP